MASQRDASKMSRTSALKRLMSPKPAMMTSSSLRLSSGRKHVQSSSSQPCRQTGSKRMLSTLPPMWTKVKSSTMHHKRLRYDGPQKTTMRLQPLRKMGRQRKSSSMLRWSMQHLSIQTLGSRPCLLTNSARHRCMASHFAPASSCQECETKASQLLSLQLSVFAHRAGLGTLSAMSWNSTSSRRTQRKRSDACARTSLAVQFPTSPATLAAAHCVLRASNLIISVRRKRSCHDGRRISESATAWMHTHNHWSEKQSHSRLYCTASQMVVGMYRTTQPASSIHNHLWTSSAPEQAAAHKIPGKKSASAMT
mmetsp:Transcript_81624/g.228926  ORF Transcript_81624/g.228926 Transcript_81624/m.228926 type:complete len:309 (-) Transcript_81624:444-1370(-)